MIQLFHVDKFYSRDKSALRDVSLRILPGEFCFLTGPSGAGKTTLLKTIFREVFPTNGQVIVNGRNVTTISDSRIPFMRRQMGVVFQDFKLLNKKTVLENVTFVLRLLGVGRKERRRRAFEVLRWVGLQDRMEALPLELSGGEQQRVAIARALINEPLLLLADEPTGNLDTDLSIEILRLFEQINARGTTILMATHDRFLLREFPKRSIHLEAGHVVHGGEPAP